MSSFSERMGYVEPRSVIQVESIDRPLLNKLWDLFADLFDRETGDVERSVLVRSIWMHFLEKSVDDIPANWYYTRNALKTLFYSDWSWHEVYSFIEFVFSADSVSPTYTEVLNEVLERYMAGYRMVGGQIAPLTGESEVRSVEQAMASPLAGVRSHLGKALAHLSNRERPDEENSIKESVSAIEALCSAIVGKSTTLADALKRLEAGGVELHPAVKDAWSKLYGYTSDAKGIRHGFLDEPDLSVDDAVYFLVSASAFINLLTAKATKNAIELGS